MDGSMLQVVPNVSDGALIYWDLGTLQPFQAKLLTVIYKGKSL